MQKSNHVKLLGTLQENLPGLTFSVKVTWSHHYDQLLLVIAS